MPRKSHRSGCKKRTNGAARFLLDHCVSDYDKGFHRMPTTTERRTVNRRTEDIYRKAIEDIRDYAIFTMDENGIVTNWNLGAQHILGYTEEEIVGKHASKFFT